MSTNDLAPPFNLTHQFARALRKFASRPAPQKSIYVAGAPTGNLMFRIMFAHRLQEFLPGSPISGISMPEWDIKSRSLERPKRPVSAGEGHRIDVEDVVRRAKAANCDGVEVFCYAQRLEYFERKRKYFMKLFSSVVEGTTTTSQEIVFNVRTGDIVDGGHPDYMPVPIGHYRKLLKETGLRPVFVGQLSPGWYTDALRAEFPEARWLESGNWLHDFQTIRHASVIAISVSTFSWLAAWLSPTAKKIYFPVLGFFNPIQRPDVDLMPRRDDRYEYRLFPIVKYRGELEQKRWLLS